MRVKSVFQLLYETPGLCRAAGLEGGDCLDDRLPAVDGLLDSTEREGVLAVVTPVLERDGKTPALSTLPAPHNTCEAPQVRPSGVLLLPLNILHEKTVTFLQQ